MEEGEGWRREIRERDGGGGDRVGDTESEVMRVRDKGERWNTLIMVLMKKVIRGRELGVMQATEGETFYRIEEFNIL